jgi:hypothetical protein
VLPASTKLSDGSSPDVVDNLVFELKVDVKELERIHSKDWGKLPNLPSNTVLFFLPDGMYASKETSDWMSKMNLRVAASDAVMETEKRVDVNTVVKNAGKICKVAGKIKQPAA